MLENPQTMITLGVGALLWIIMMIIVLKNQFHDKKIKRNWIIALILVPPSCLLFPFIGMK